MLQPPLLLSYKQLGHIHKAVGIRRHADAYLGPACREDVPAVPGAAHKCSLRFFYRGMVGDVFTHCRKCIAEGFQHLGCAAVGGGGVRKISIVSHILTLGARYAAQCCIQLQRLQPVGCPVLIEQKKCNFLLHAYITRSIIIVCRGGRRCHNWFFGRIRLRYGSGCGRRDRCGSGRWPRCLRPLGHGCRRYGGLRRCGRRSGRLCGRRLWRQRRLRYLCQYRCIGRVRYLRKHRAYIHRGLGIAGGRHCLPAFRKSGASCTQCDGQ